MRQPTSHQPCTIRPPRLVWADAPECVTHVGDEGYLVEVDNVMRRDPGRVTFQHEAPRTNISREIRIRGWLGTYNDVARHARGRARVVRVIDTDDGKSRVQVLPLND